MPRDRIDWDSIEQLAWTEVELWSVFAPFVESELVDTNELMERPGE